MLASTVRLSGSNLAMEAIGIGSRANHQCSIGERRLGVEAGRCESVRKPTARLSEAYSSRLAPSVPSSTCLVPLESWFCSVTEKAAAEPGDPPKMPVESADRLVGPDADDNPAR